MRGFFPRAKRCRFGPHETQVGVAEDFVVWLSIRFVLAANEPIYLVEQEVVKADSALVLSGELVFAKRFGIDTPHVTRNPGARAIEEHHPAADVALPDFG